MKKDQGIQVGKTKQSAKTVVVLGMAKGGTSVTSGILYLLGVNMGYELKGPSHSNPKGYFEDKDFIELHHRIYEAARPGSSYWDPPAYNEIMAQREQFEAEIRALVTRKRAKSSLWGWKLPWTNLTVELFLPHLRNPHIVAVFRNPLGNARSFERHNRKLARIESLMLVNHYNQLILSFLKNHPEIPRTFVAFEEMVKDPISVSTALADFLGLELTEPKREAIRELVIPREKIEYEKFKRRGLKGRLRYFGSRIKRRLFH